MVTFIDKLREREDLVTNGTSACKGCGGEMLLRRTLKIAGPNSICIIPPGCMAGAGSIGWDETSGMKIPVTLSLLTNTASFAAGVSRYYQKIGREDVNVIAFAGDGATADAGFQALSGACERNEKILYVCYDNEGYMNTGYQRSSTTSEGSRTSTTPIGKLHKGKPEPSKFLPLIMLMHNPEYMATASPSNMNDFVKKVEKGVEASKRGFAYLHLFAPCPTGWGYKSEESIEFARNAVKSNIFPLIEYENGKLEVRKNPNPMKVKEFINGIKKYRHMDESAIELLQETTDHRMEILSKLEDK